MFPDAEKFLARFRETRFDVIVRRTCEIAFQIAEAIIVVGAFRYLAERYSSPLALIAQWVLMLALAMYVGNRTSYFLSGTIRGRGAWHRWHDFVIFPMAILLSVSTVLFILKLVDYVVMQQAASG